MTTLRRILIGSATIVAACGLASANSITYGIDPTTGNDYVTQTVSATGSTGVLSFLSFASLVAANPGTLAGTTYINGDSTFDYELQTNVSSFTITNNKGSADTVNAQVNDVINVDAGTTMPTSNGTGGGNGDVRTAAAAFGLPITNFTNTTLTNALPAAAMTNITLAAAGNDGSSFTYSPLPVVTTFGIFMSNYGNPGCANNSAFGTLGCSEVLTSNSYATTGFSFGLDGNQQTASSESSSGGGNTTNLNILASSTYNTLGEVTYEYAPPPSGVPEPATMALMGGALLGLGLIGKKRFKNS
jgi:hypothetical protein